MLHDGLWGITSQEETSVSQGESTKHWVFFKAWILPSGYVKIAIEHGPVEIVNFPIKHGDFPVRYVTVYQRIKPGCQNYEAPSHDSEQSSRWAIDWGYIIYFETSDCKMSRQFIPLYVSIYIYISLSPLLPVNIPILLTKSEYWQ